MTARGDTMQGLIQPLAIRATLDLSDRIVGLGGCGEEFADCRFEHIVLYRRRAVQDWLAAQEMPRAKVAGGRK